MARVAGRSAEATKEAALLAATSLFASRGFDRASMGAIAKDAGITAAALAYHFGDKAGLYRAVFDRVYAELPQLAQAIRPDLTLRELARVGVDFAAERRDSVRLLMRSIADAGGLPDDVRQRMPVVLTMVGGRLAQAYGADPTRARRGLVVATHLVLRFVTNTWADNALALGTDSEGATWDAVADLVAEVCGAVMHVPLDARPT